MAEPTSMAAAILKGWPVVLTAAGCLMGYGSLRSDVSQVKLQQAAQISDHDRLVRMEEQIKRTQSDIAEIKADVKALAKGKK